MFNSTPAGLLSWLCKIVVACLTKGTSPMIVITHKHGGTRTYTYAGIYFANKLYCYQLLNMNKGYKLFTM